MHQSVDGAAVVGVRGELVAAHTFVGEHQLEDDAPAVIAAIVAIVCELAQSVEGPFASVGERAHQSIEQLAGGGITLFGGVDLVLFGVSRRELAQFTQPLDAVVEVEAESSGRERSAPHSLSPPCVRPRRGPQDPRPSRSVTPATRSR